MNSILWSDWEIPLEFFETLLAMGKPLNFVSDEWNGLLSKPLGGTLFVIHSTA
jgi:hypothetical protein